MEVQEGFPDGPKSPRPPLDTHIVRLCYPLILPRQQWTAMDALTRLQGSLIGGGDGGAGGGLHPRVTEEAKARPLLPLLSPGQTDPL